MNLLKSLSVTLLGLVICSLVALPTGAADKDKHAASGTMGTIERVDPRFDRLVPPDAVIEKLAGGFAWVEGPVWVPRQGGYLLFSDIPNNTVFKWK
ncbi:MAG: SMP-30/gluconolactonase/LRE family protein, partial [Planctomycetes bacterium]|nr:SMP-30/gluconolactonase/LRE family protein [Planctomycetota bacterium]